MILNLHCCVMSQSLHATIVLLVFLIRNKMRERPWTFFAKLFVKMATSLARWTSKG